MTKMEIIEKAIDLVCDPWTETEEEIEHEKSFMAACMDNGDVSDYISVLEEHRDYECKPVDGIHGEYDFERMREYDEVIDELKEWKGEQYEQIDKW